MEGKELATCERVAVSGKTGLGTGWRGRMRRTRPSGAVVSLSVVGYASRRDDFVPSSSRASRFLNRPPRAHTSNSLSLSPSLLYLSSAFPIPVSLSLSFSRVPSLSIAHRRFRARARARECGNVAAHFKSLASSRRGCRRPRSPSRMSVSACVCLATADRTRVISRDPRGGATE